MAKYIQHSQEVWDLENLTHQEKTILNYCWAWKKRQTGPVTVQDSYLTALYSMPQHELSQIWWSLQHKKYIAFDYVPAGPRIIHCLDLNKPKEEDDFDIFDHLY